MHDSSTRSIQDSSPAALGRIANALASRHWSTFIIELLLIVVGIIVALSIDDWAQQRKDENTEEVYLRLLIRDLDQMAEQLQAYIDTETSMATSSAKVLKILSGDGYERQGETLRGYLSDMGTRRTLRMVSAAYTDLTSTGNLQLIHTRSLRDKLLRYFAAVARSELVIEKNNAVFIDDMYWSFMLNGGITWAPTHWHEMGPILSRADGFYREFLGPGIAYPTDAILAQPADAEFWNQIRRMCFLRLRVSATGLSLAETLIEQTEQLRSAIDEELRNAS
jgi:hypothetical protein